MLVTSRDGWERTCPDLSKKILLHYLIDDWQQQEDCRVQVCFGFLVGSPAGSSATSMCIDFVVVHQSSLCSRLSQTECREIRQRRHLSSMGQYFSEKHSKHRTSVIAKSERSNFLQESLDKH